MLEELECDDDEDNMDTAVLLALPRSPPALASPAGRRRLLCMWCDSDARCGVSPSGAAVEAADDGRLRNDAVRADTSATTANRQQVEFMQV